MLHMAGSHFGIGTGTGKTPDLIRHACKLITLRELAPKGAASGGVPASALWRPSELKTRDQTIKFAPANAKALGRASTGLYTGDPAIDQILLKYRRPPRIRSV